MNRNIRLIQYPIDTIVTLRNGSKCRIIDMDMNNNKFYLWCDETHCSYKNNCNGTNDSCEDYDVVSIQEQDESDIDNFVHDIFQSYDVYDSERPSIGSIIVASIEYGQQHPKKCNMNTEN